MTPSIEQARAYLAQGRLASAKGAFLAVLLRDRHHRDAMLGLAEVFIALEDFQSARVVLEEAVARHPDCCEAQSALGGTLLELDDLAGARAAFESALRIDPVRRKPWVGLGVVFERAGEIERADRAWREAFRDAGPAISAYRGQGEPLRVLLVRSAVEGNVPLKRVFDDRLFQCITLFAESYHEAMELPPHAVVFNLVGNAELGGRALDAVQRTLRATTTPVINHPRQIVDTGRLRVAERMREIPGIVTPRMRIVNRHELDDDGGLGWPLLVRALGFHTGEHFAKIEDPAQLPETLADLPGEELLAIEYLETRSTDGMYRKFRLLTIDGRLYPAHLAVSPQWKVHYQIARRGDAVEREERAFLADPAAVIGSGALHALERAAERLGLDYGGFDFALDRSGRIVLFEANATMRIGANAPAIDAVRNMIRRRSRERATLPND